MPQPLEGMGMDRVLEATSEGGPKAPENPEVVRVSMMRQGVTEMNCNWVVIRVRSLAWLLAVLLSPPPDTLAMLVTLVAAEVETVTVKVMGGYEPPAARASERVQGPEG